MVDYLYKKPKLSFVDDLGKLYRQRRRATQAKGLKTLDLEAEVEGPSESPRDSPPPSPKEDQPQPPPMGEQPQPEHKIELCTPDIVYLPIINLQDARRPFKIKVSTIRMTIAGLWSVSMNTYEPNSLSGISVYLRGGWRRWR
jgi:hypothetical protein